jgi:hypothetical protein
LPRCRVRRAVASDRKRIVAGVSIKRAVELSAAMFEFAARSAASAAGASAGASPEYPQRCNTETLPLNAGIEINNAVSMKTIDAAIVNFDRTEAVPRGPNAALDTLLVKSAPASVLPGCSKTAATNTMHETKNTVYKTYSKLLTYL